MPSADSWHARIGAAWIDALALLAENVFVPVILVKPTRSRSRGPEKNARKFWLSLWTTLRGVSVPSDVKRFARTLERG